LSWRGPVGAHCESDPDLVDLSKLQQWDFNWDGRQPGEGEARPTATRWAPIDARDDGTNYCTT